MPGDRAKSRERKIKALEEAYSSYRDWGIFKTCALCGREFLVNNYEDRKPRTPRIFKRPVCPWCRERNGRLRLAEHILVQHMVDHGCEFQDYDSPPNIDTCKCLFCIARRTMEKMDVKDDPAG